MLCLHAKLGTQSCAKQKEHGNKHGSVFNCLLATQMGQRLFAKQCAQCLRFIDMSSGEKFQKML